MLQPKTIAERVDAADLKDSVLSINAKVTEAIFVAEAHTLAAAQAWEIVRDAELVLANSANCPFEEREIARRGAVSANDTAKTLRRLARADGGG